MSSEFRRMYETRAHRPYYTIANLGGMGKPLFDITGFGYCKTVYIISSGMNNTAYFNVEEMAQATDQFRELWNDENKVGQILDLMKDRFQRAMEAEERAWGQTWSLMETQDLIEQMRFYFDLDMLSLGTMYVSNPQHVSPLEERINALLEGNPRRDAILHAATTFDGRLPGAEEDDVIAELREQWDMLSSEVQEKALENLVNDFGWFNEIEGDTPFDREHYRQRVMTSSRKSPASATTTRIPDDVLKVGELIGELGFLRLWNRHHFMHLRYHLKKILEELTKRLQRPELEFATIREVEAFFQNQSVDWDEIARRREGYVAFLDDEREPHLVTGKQATKLKERVQEESSSDGVVRGNIATRGYVTGRVRIISFTASDYDEQVSAFEEGEILVTGMTRPQIIHLCKKASAIVTDEGGITCHAAVVSRELEIPCIIATHDATKLLKTGDQVVVDARERLEGTVTRIVI
jgi:phosphohistidine swiveling domain-containing protein